MSDENNKDIDFEKNKLSQASMTETDDMEDDLPEEENGKKGKKTFDRSSLPKIFRKSYPEKKLNKKLIKPVAIPLDKEFLSGIFVKGADPKKPDFFAVPQDSVFTKKEMSRLRLIAKDIQSRKGRFLFLPFAAVVGFFVLLCAAFTAIKNPLLKKILTAACESAVGAKTDIGYVNLRLLDGSLTIKNVAVGNKDSVMKNVVEFDNLVLDFNVVQALSGKVDAQNLELTGLKFNTDRKESCELPEKQKKVKESKPLIDEQQFMDTLKQRSENAITDLQNQAFDMIGGSDVEEIVANLRSQLKSIDTAKNGMNQVESLVGKWKEKPDELQAKMDAYSETVKKLSNLDVEKLTDPAVLKDYLATIQTVTEETKKLKDVAVELKDGVVADANSVRTISDDIASSVKADKDFVKGRLSAVKDTFKNSKQLLISALDTVAYNMLGNYYPYIKTGLGYAEQLKQNAYVQQAIASGKDKSKVEKKPGSKRLAGKTFQFTAEKPKLLIEHALVSGENFEATLEEVTDNQNCRNKPTVAKAKFVQDGITHAADLILDIRSKSDEPLVKVNYTGDGIKAVIDGAKIASKSGIPSVEGLAKISLSGAADTGFLSALGSVELTPLKLTSDGFASELMTKYYLQALDAVKEMLVGYDFNFTELDGISLDFTGDFADKFSQVLKSIVEGLGTEAKDKALARLNKEINNASDEYLVKAKEFLGIEGEVNVQDTKLSDIQALLEKRKTEIEERIKELAKSKVNSAMEDAGIPSEKAEKAVDAASNLFKKLKK